MSSSSTSFRARIDAVRERVDITHVVGGVVKLGNGAKPRGKCPFHGSKSDSFTLYPDTGSARCWGCDWSGDAIKFVQEYFGLSFIEALQRLEGEHGLDGLNPAPVHREKQVRVRPYRPSVDSTTMGRHIWKQARPDGDAVRTYLLARGVPRAMLEDARLLDIRFCGTAPIRAWRADAKPGSVPHAPAMVALVRRPGGEEPGEDVRGWPPIGLHVTYLSPCLTHKMARQRDDGEVLPARKMLGVAAGGCVVLGPFAAAAPLFVGEGLETVLSGMALAGARDDACGLAVLSLDNLQGHARLIKGALPIHDPQPDSARGQALAFRHGGPVTGLIDADMKPLRGPIDRATGVPRGLPVIERRGGPIVRRVISTAERAALCGTLFVRAWRAKGCRATAIRPRMGRDFNDAVREAV